MFPKISTEKDRSGHSTAYPDVCKIPAPPAPFSPTPFPNTHSQKLNTAKTKVVKLAKDVESGKITKTKGDEPGIKQGVATIKNIEKLIVKHQGELKKAPRQDYSTAARSQKAFEVKIEGQVKELTRLWGKERGLNKVVDEIKKVVGKAARGH